MGKKGLVKDAISALKIGEPYKLQNPGGIALKPPSTTSKPSQDQSKPRAFQTGINSTADHTDQSSTTPAVKQTGGFNVMQFLPPGRAVELCEKSDGSLMIPHKIYEFIHKAITKKVELLVFDCLLRFTLGFRRPQCEASLSFLSKWTGLEPSNIRKALYSLADSGFILCVRHGSADQQSSIYELPMVREYLTFEQRQRSMGDSSSDQSNLSPNPTEFASSRSTGEIDLGPGVDSTTKKETSQKIDLKKALPFSSETHEIVRSYFSKKYPPRRLERDIRLYKALRQAYGEKRTGQALEALLTHGTIGKGEIAYSPWDYLSVSINEILESVDTKERIEADKLLQVRRQKAEQEQLEQEEREALIREKAFIETFPSPEDQAKIISSLCEGLPLDPCGRVARRLAIGIWWSDNPKAKTKNSLATKEGA